jgi:hypothetical protein
VRLAVDAPSQVGGIMIVDVSCCARCGKDHKDLEFKEFKGWLPEDATGIQWTHWGMCPDLNEPIMLIIKQVIGGN